MDVNRRLSKLPHLQVLDELCVGVADTYVLTQFDDGCIYGICEDW